VCQQDFGVDVKKYTRCGAFGWKRAPTPNEAADKNMSYALRPAAATKDQAVTNNWLASRALPA